MKKTLFLIIIPIFLITISFAQDFAFGTVTGDELNMQKYNKDTSAHAVVLLEHGRAEIEATNSDNIRLNYEYHVKIKIFDKTAFNWGKVELPVYLGTGENDEEIQDIKGITTFKNDNGTMSTVELDKSKIYTSKDDKHHNTIKFDMPGLQPGCIIEYKYRLVTPYISNFHPWQFQSTIPKIYSEYDVHIPGFWEFNASLKGGLKLTKNTSELQQGCFSFRGAKSDCSHFVYAMSDIPAFIIEDYMTAPRNFASAITFELSGETSLEGGGAIKYAKEWKDVDYDLKHADYFGSQLKKESLFKDKIAPIIAEKKDDIDKARAIYAYIKTQIKWDGNNDYGSEDGIKQALAQHTGNAAEVNFCLFDALKAAGLNPEAVLLSTREHGIINRLYPVRTEFDYVVVKLDVGDKSYFLDATEPLLSFGMLPMRCLNDQGRVMSLDKPSYWVDMITQQKENDTYQLDLTLQNDGKIKGTITHYNMGYSAYLKRKEIKKFNSVDEYIESINEQSTKFKIVSSQIDNLDSLDKPLLEVFTVEIKEYNSTDHSRLSFNPYMQGRITENPFKLTERSYPVDWGMPSSTRYIMTMHLPDNYSIETDPQKASYGLPNNGGSFITDYSADGNTFTFSYAMQFNKSIYFPEEYPYLKEFYTKMILSEKNEMIFKKKM
jgi:hypothetical protein